MKRAALLALAVAATIPTLAQADGMRSGRRLDAIATGRIYDPQLTPQMNPSFSLEPNAEAQLLRDIQSGRFNIDRLPEGQRQYYLFRLEQGR